MLKRVQVFGARGLAKLLVMPLLLVMIQYFLPDWCDIVGGVAGLMLVM